MTHREDIAALAERMNASILGQEAVVDRLLIALLANGNVLMEGLPGLAKTRAIKAMAAHLEAEFSRIQFTPDLLPSDVTGSEIYVEGAGESTFQFRPGPIFGNLILADEINRAPAKVQAALLEAMEERQVTVAGKVHKMPELFMILATQNPIEQEGTYPLPEAQMDRFLMHVRIDYPDKAAEIEVLRLVRGEEQPQGAENELMVEQSAIFGARQEVHAIAIGEVIESYIIDLIHATRAPEKLDEQLAGWIDVGASPRGGLALDKASRAHAWLAGRDHVTPDDVRAVAHDCLRHRLVLGFEADAQGLTKDDVLNSLLERVAVA
jgi:MoxR-like ATPase